MKRIAVIGSGISGLSAAYLLSRKHEVTLFEKNTRIGGHTHTHTVETSRGPLPVDTGFIVHNDRTYPNLIRLFEELNVETAPSDMSFAVSCRATGYEWSSRGLGGFFAQRANLFKPAHYRLFRAMVRFNRIAPLLLDQPEAADLTLGDWLRANDFPDELAEFYLIPMAGAVWSTSPDAMLRFPALTLIRFFHNHGFLGLNTHPEWRVVRGGSSAYLAPIMKPYAPRIERGVEVKLRRLESCVELSIAAAGRMRTARFDDAVLACHGDEVLPVLDDPSDVEREVFGSFKTNRNETCLHTDGRLLPTRERARASWNYNIDLEARGAVTVTYHMNRLQALPAPEPICVTLNGNGSVDPAKVIQRMVYDHPLYTSEAIRAQSRWTEVSGGRRTHYCGAYWFYGFHEDGLNSAIRVANSLGVEW